MQSTLQRGFNVPEASAGTAESGVVVIWSPSGSQPSRGPGPAPTRWLVRPETRVRKGQTLETKQPWAGPELATELHPGCWNAYRGSLW